jgi:hypothetical protein
LCREEAGAAAPAGTTKRSQRPIEGIRLHLSRGGSVSGTTDDNLSEGQRKMCQGRIISFADQLSAQF